VASDNVKLEGLRSSPSPVYMGPDFPMTLRAWSGLKSGAGLLRELSIGSGSVGYSDLYTALELVTG